MITKIINVITHVLAVIFSTLAKLMDGNPYITAGLVMGAIHYMMWGNAIRAIAFGLIPTALFIIGYFLAYGAIDAVSEQIHKIKERIKQ